MSNTADLRATIQTRVDAKFDAKIETPEEFNEETAAAMEEARAIAKGDIYAKRYNSFSEAMEELKD
ncbi:MAG: hypothetical protein MJZ26_13750 [Fibrobacter sp.]|nr:hypothetical protein [Fibrobacter sp.]